MEMIAMLGSAPRGYSNAGTPPRAPVVNPGPLTMPVSAYTGFNRAPMVAGLGAEPDEPKKDEKPLWKKPGFWLGATAFAVVGYAIWRSMNPSGQEEADRLYEEYEAQQSMERGMPIRTDGLAGNFRIVKAHPRHSRKRTARKGRK